MPKKVINIATNYSQGGLNPLSTENRRLIEAVSPRIKVWDINELFHAEKNGDTTAKKRLDAIFSETEIYCGHSVIDNIISRAPKLKWIQSAVAGVDRLMTPDIIDSPVIVTKAKIHDQQISENIYNFMLMLARNSIDHIRAQEKRTRVRLMPTVLHSKTLGILGLGNIGEATARLGKAFGMKVMAMRAHPEKSFRYVDIMVPPSGLHELLEKSDFVVILLPLTKDTTDLIGEKELRLMKPTAYVINVARGAIVNQQALVRALREKWIAGAGLDVLASDPGPVPDDVWELRNVILTSHLAGQRTDYYDILTKLLCKNLKRYLSGKELLNVVDKKEGY